MADAPEAPRRTRRTGSLQRRMIGIAAVWITLLLAGVIVITVTGHGLKDPDAILKQNIPLAPTIPATREAILNLLR